MSIIKRLHTNGHLSISAEDSFAVSPDFEVIMGSVAYGASSENSSDMDIHAIAVPPMEMVFPHLQNHIQGFGDPPKNFTDFQQHHIKAFDKDYDVAIYSIVKFFNLTSGNNPNMLDLLWVPEHCVIHCSNVGEHIVMNRQHFLSKGAYHRFRGYAHSQLGKLEKTPRTDLVEKYGYDTKHAYHIVRLALQAEQILEMHDMNFSLNSTFLKEVRNGAMKLNELKDWYSRKEKDLDLLYNTSTLRHSPDMNFLKEVMLACLEIKYGSLDKVYQGAEADAFRKLEAIKRIVNG